MNERAMVSSAASLAAFARLVVLLLVCGRATPRSSTPAFMSGLGSRGQIHCAARRRFRLASPASAVAPPDAAVQVPPPLIPSAAATCGARAEWLHTSSAPVLNDTTLAALRERGYAVVENFLSLDEAAVLRLDASEARPRTRRAARPRARAPRRTPPLARGALRRPFTPLRAPGEMAFHSLSFSPARARAARAAPTRSRRGTATRARFSCVDHSRA